MAMPPREGQRIGNYRLQRLLGKGAFAEVYLGEHLYLRNYAAIKLLHTTLTEEDEQLFLAEAQTIARLTHPNIVHVREFAIERSLPFLAMDYAPGGTLRQLYPRGTCLSLAKTVSYVKQIAAALQYAHNHGIIHRDVKPENMLQGSDQVMLSDFGISIHAPTRDSLDSQQWGGTLPYMAPEQLQSRAVFASDQYALAIVVYEWLCGVRPFEGSALSLAYKHERVAPAPLREKDPSLPAAVETVVLKALAKKPEDRYPSVINFARALERAIQEDSGSEVSAEARTDQADAPPTTLARSIFLSHTPADDVILLQKDLSIRDINVIAEAAPEVQEEKLRQAMRAAQAVVLALSPHTRSAMSVKEHLRIAELYKRPVVGVWIEGDKLSELLPSAAEQATIFDARGVRYQQALAEIVSFLDAADRRAVRSEVQLPELDFEPRNPYKGLYAFTQQDRADFFGRETVVQDLLARIKAMLPPATMVTPDPRLLAVIGPSGSGKSSVVMAGLLPRLQDGSLPGSADWIYLRPLVPGKQPFTVLAHALAAHLPAQGLQGVQDLLAQENGLGLHQAGLALARQAGTRVVVTIDQFEELFSSDVTERERQHFIQLLVFAATQPGGPVIILLTLRADFYDRPFQYADLGRLIQRQQCAVLPMSAADLRAVIEGPAFLPDVRLLFDEDLVGDLLFDMRDQAGALPLLEFALDQLFAHRRGHRLTRYAYQEIGGVRGALSRHAEATYTALPSDAHRRLARTLFLRLVQSGAQGQEPLRRSADVGEFVLADAEQTRVLQEVSAAFIAARLITLSQFAGNSTLEISHETLIREWPRLATWIQESREDMHLQQMISNDVREWERRGRSRDRLYRGGQLKELLAWQGRNVVSGSESTFLRASSVRRTRARISIALLVLLLLAILVPAGIVFQQQFAPLTVTTLQDDAPGSLRQALANVRSGGTITIDPNLKGTLTLSRDLIINKNVTIRGAVVDQLKIAGARDATAQGLIQINAHDTVILSQLTFSDPVARPGPVITNDGTLTLDDCHLTGNVQKGVALPDGVAAAGGAIINNPGGTLTLQNSLIAHNTITGEMSFGGGISTAGGTLIVTNSQILNNQVTSTSNNQVTSTNQFAAGGGIYSENSHVTITNSSINDNKAILRSTSTGNIFATGGGIYMNRGTLSIQGSQSQISDNSVLIAEKGTGYGGGISNNGGTLTIDATHMLGNTVTGKADAAGGALYSQDQPAVGQVGASPGLVSFTKSVLSNNMVLGNTTALYSSAWGAIGGGITLANGSLTLSGSTVDHNTLTSQVSLARGGGLFSGGTLTITDSDIAGNSATAPTKQNGAFGGGLYTVGSLNGKQATFSQNSANSSQGVAAGGGIYAGSGSRPGARLDLKNCTIADNQAQGAQGVGGGLALDKQAVPGSIDFCTIADNSAATRAGGIDGAVAKTPDATLLTLKNSIVANNTASTAPDISHDLITGGYNLIGNQAGATLHDALHMQTSDITGARASNSGLAAQLGNNGGPTPTLALQANSPAIDAVPTSACDLTTDQRGVKRPQQRACDIGAYEYAQP